MKIKNKWKKKKRKLNARVKTHNFSNAAVANAEILRVNKILVKMYKFKILKNNFVSNKFVAVKQKKKLISFKI